MCKFICCNCQISVIAVALAVITKKITISFSYVYIKAASNIMNDLYTYIEFEIEVCGVCVCDSTVDNACQHISITLSYST